MYIVNIDTVTGNSYKFAAVREPDLCDGLLNIETSEKDVYFNIDNIICWSEEESENNLKTISIFDEDYNEKIHNSL